MTIATSRGSALATGFPVSMNECAGVTCDASPVALHSEKRLLLCGRVSSALETDGDNFKFRGDPSLHGDTLLNHCAPTKTLFLLYSQVKGNLYDNSVSSLKSKSRGPLNFHLPSPKPRKSASFEINAVVLLLHLFRAFAIEYRRPAIHGKKK